MNLALGAILAGAVLLAPVALLLLKRNDRALLHRLRRHENRALERFLWFS